MLKITAKEEKSTIKQGTIAQFMRKRTQLVGFEFGYWKHSQYAAEFLDNALDAIESFQWKELEKKDSKIKFTLDQELSLENLSIVQTEKVGEKSQPLNNEAKLTLMQEFGLSPSESKEIKVQLPKNKQNKAQTITDKSKIEVEQEVKIIIDCLEEIIQPIISIIDDEPIVIIRLREFEAASFLTSELSQKNVMDYTFEIFDNGTGMTKVDLRKFGRYLASSKSMQLKQTRGSQGFGAPSAFSDAQNTTGRPIVAVSKSIDNVYATVSEFFTTSKNEKKYIIHPTEIDSPFLHGTYIKLNYLNVKYIRGYVDTYIKETAFMNPHITIIYIDPYNEEHIYPRKVSFFPKQPKYAKPHPSSTNIGDLQDLLTKSENLTLTSFLKENFVRITQRIAKQILDLAERDMQDKLNLLILKTGFIEVPQKQSDHIHFLRFEKRIFGRSEKLRDKLIIYQIASNDLKDKYWDLISKYNNHNKNRDKINKQIKKWTNKIENADTQKTIKNIEKEIRKLLKNIDEIRKEKDKIKLQIENFFNNVKDGLIELKKFKNRTDFEDLINEVQISKAKPAELTNEQFKSLFQAFKSIKYMAPPTDTAIPVGAPVLENTLIKEIGLKVSENLDDYDAPVERFLRSIDILYDEKKKAIIQENPNIEDEVLNSISVDSEEIIGFNSMILSNIAIKDESVDSEQLKQSLDDILSYSEVDSKDQYQEVFEYFSENYTKDDDFVVAETREPTSGKGLAYVVEAVLAYSKLIEVPKRSRDVLSRFVNRTPKLRDSADCAITKAVQSVNWKNYKLETYDNNLPKGSIKLLVNVSGPFVHLMFKSQSKNALADDEDLIKEIKFCLEAIGRKLRVYLNRRATIHKSEKRASLIEKYIPKFVKSLSNIALTGESKYKEKIKEEELQKFMRDAIGKKVSPLIPYKIEPEKPAIMEKELKKEKPKKVEIKKEEIFPKKDIIIKKAKPKKEGISAEILNNWPVKKLRAYCNENNIEIPSKIRKTDIINKIQESFVKKPIKEKPKIEIPKKPVKIEPLAPGTIKAAKTRLKTVKGQLLSKPKTIKTLSKPKPRVASPKPIQTHLPIITNASIIAALSDEWQTIKHLIFKLKIKDMMDARFLQIKLKELERKEMVLVDIKIGKKHWKLK
ncbi:MAG: hypothetical protein ACFFAN_07200 [Promethearchaeota archaeon]